MGCKSSNCSLSGQDLQKVITLGQNALPVVSIIILFFTYFYAMEMF